MDTFVRVAEIWVPSPRDCSELELGQGLYGELEAFREVSTGTRFGFGEGLPGKAWAAGHPIILKDLANSYFKRGEAAAGAGLTCAVAVPVFTGEFLRAVLVLLGGDDREHVGAIELWTNPDGSSELGLVDGYYGSAETFEWASRRTRFQRGMGLPGKVWEQQQPVVMEDLGRARRFLRWADAQRVGINKGLGIPCGRRGEQRWVMTFLSALGTPIAKRFEVWAPDAARRSLVFRDGICVAEADLPRIYDGVTIARGAGTLGKVWRTGAPAVSAGVDAEPQLRAVRRSRAFTTMLALPIVEDCRLVSIVTWYL
jgi:hypothetical protein